MEVGNEAEGENDDSGRLVRQVTERLNSFGGGVGGVEIHFGEGRRLGGEEGAVL